jgi:glycine cleavage system H protein
MDPQDLRFAKSHEWIAADGTVGLSDHAQHEITDVVFVEPPAVSRSVRGEESCAVVESVKAAFDIYAPVAGNVAAVNEAVVKNPALLNQSPYGEGWLFKLNMADPAARNALMTHDQYQQFLKQGGH